MPRRVIYAGLIHETHTFLDSATTRADFTIALGPDILGRAGDGSVVDGFLEVAREMGWEIVPTLVMTAMPSGTVEDDVFEFFWTEFAGRAGAALREGVDAVFLSLHGAMATRSFPDVEGELLARIRALPGGGGVRLFGTLDLHANASARMTGLAQALVAFAENPHTDARATSVRAARLLQRSLETGVVPRMRWRGAPIVWPPTGTGTADEPMRSLERLARRIEAEDAQVWAVNVLAGYSFADTPDTGVSFSLVTDGSGPDQERHLDALARLAWELRREGDVSYPSADDVLANLGPARDGPVILVEPSDNIGGGAPGDGTGLLRALLRRDAVDALVVLDDPESVRRLAGARPGDVVALAVGGRGWAGDPGPVPLAATLVSQSDGRFELEDLHSHLAASVGRRIDMGPTAVVRCRGLTLLLTSRKTPPFDLGQLRSQGIEPTRLAIIGVKAAVGHRQAYDPIAGASWFVDTPGPCRSDLSGLPFRRLRRPIHPLDPSASLP
jgi:microcystin degradation protein MlrC